MHRLSLTGLLLLACTGVRAGEPPKADIHLTPGAAPPSPEIVAALAEKDRPLFDAVFGDWKLARVIS